ncbi:CBS domain-containing protein [Stieleria varia]|uniref:Hypoxic response protein 1 n=1 Tax=Stieleria varia TaxID=2528005 RepID=A0A5C6B375_9BACT|nr:CBS domain-containing protein [Stieleria varia]TWU04934.1 Hypoxic response protein 1 [Stieleria varia]
MKLKDVMTTHVRGISADESVRNAAEAMSQMQVGSLPVFRDGKPIGIITDRDIVVRCVAAGLDCSQTPCRQAMTGELITLPETTDIEAAASAMEERQIRRLLVTGENYDIVGIVSVGDIAANSGSQKVCAELIERMSVPAEPVRFEAVQ